MIQVSVHGYRLCPTLAQPPHRQRRRRFGRILFTISLINCEANLLKAANSTAALFPMGPDSIDPESLTKKRPPAESLHLNVRVSGDDVQIFEHLRSRTPSVSDSLRVRDSVRVAVFLLAMKETGKPVTCFDASGREVDVLDHLGVFFPDGEPQRKKPARARRG